MTGNPILKTGQVEQELGKMSGWLLRRVGPAREYSTPIFCVRFQSFSDQMRFRILLLPTENSNPDIMGCISSATVGRGSRARLAVAEPNIRSSKSAGKVLFERLRDVGAMSAQRSAA
jgi:hypothetical protein